MPEDPGRLHVVGVTGSGRLYHTMRTPGGRTPFGDVLGPGAANQPQLQGTVTEVAAARAINVLGTASPSAMFSEALVVVVLASTQPLPLFFYRRFLHPRGSCLPRFMTSPPDAIRDSTFIAGPLSLHELPWVRGTTTWACAVAKSLMQHRTVFTPWFLPIPMSRPLLPRNWLMSVLHGIACLMFQCRHHISEVPLRADLHRFRRYYVENRPRNSFHTPSGE